MKTTSKKPMTLEEKFKAAVWTSRENYRSEVAAGSNDAKRINELLGDLTLNGLTSLIITTRAKFPTAEDIIKNWTMSVTMLGDGTVATVGDLVRLCCFDANTLRICDKYSDEEIFAEFRVQAVTEKYTEVFADIGKAFRDNAALPVSERRWFHVLKKLILSYDLTRKYELNKFGFNPTLPVLTNEMLDALEMPKDAYFSLCDITCGNGTFLLAAQKKFPNIKLFGVDINPLRVYTIAALLYPNEEICEGLFIGDSLKMCTEGKLPRVDVVAANPPYSGFKKEGSTKRIKIYQDFVNVAVLIADKVTMVTPSQHFSKTGIGELNQLQSDLVHKYGMKKLVEKREEECFFTKVGIASGVSYFACEKGYEGDVLFNGVETDLKERVRISEAYFPLDFSILKAVALVNEFGSISEMVQTSNISTNEESVKDGILCCFASEKKGDTFTGKTYIRIVDAALEKEGHSKSAWKVAISKQSVGNDPEHVKTFVFLVPPGMIVSTTYNFFSFKTEEEQKEFYTYLTSNEVLKLLLSAWISQSSSSATFRFVPNIRDASLLR